MPVVVAPARSVAWESKEMNLPLALIAGLVLWLFADAPAAVRLTSVTMPVVVSCRNTSVTPLSSPATMPGEDVSNTTYRPSLLTIPPPRRLPQLSACSAVLAVICVRVPPDGARAWAGAATTPRPARAATSAVVRTLIVHERLQRKMSQLP